METGKTTGRWNTYLERIWSKAKRMSNLILWVSRGKDGLRPRTAIHLWNTLVRPIVEYACELWEGDVSKKWVDKLEALQCSFAAAVLGLPSTTPRTGIRSECGLHPLHVRRKRLRLNYWKRLWDAPESTLLGYMFRWRLEGCSGQSKTGNSWCEVTVMLMNEWAWESTAPARRMARYH